MLMTPSESRSVRLDLRDTRPVDSAGGEDRREVEVVRDDDEIVLVRPGQDFVVWRRWRADG
jgi:hypothetical protein